jgi:hypothetical protein
MEGKSMVHLPIGNSLFHFSVFLQDFYLHLYIQSSELERCRGCQIIDVLKIQISSP